MDHILDLECLHCGAKERVSYGGADDPRVSYCRKCGAELVYIPPVSCEGCPYFSWPDYDESDGRMLVLPRCGLGIVLPIGACKGKPLKMPTFLVAGYQI